VFDVESDLEPVRVRTKLDALLLEQKELQSPADGWMKG
jgi:hypothetical protein